MNNEIKKTNKQKNIAKWCNLPAGGGGGVLSKPDCMVKMMKELVRIQVASSHVMGPTLLAPIML